MIDNINRLDLVLFIWEGDEYGEKFIQTAKNEFVSKKGNFREIFMTKTHTKKILHYLSNNNANKEDDIDDSSNNELKN